MPTLFMKERDIEPPENARPWSAAEARQLGVFSVSPAQLTRATWRQNSGQFSVSPEEQEAALNQSTGFSVSATQLAIAYQNAGHKAVWITKELGNKNAELLLVRLKAAEAVNDNK